MTVGVLGCHGENKPKPQKSPSPAKIEKGPDESEIAQITLTAEAETRLGITVAQVERKTIQRYRTLGGDVVVPPDRTIVVSAPVSGTVNKPSDEGIPTPGSHVRAGDVLLSFAPLLTPERYVPTPAERIQMADARASLVSAQIAADGEAKRSQAEVEAGQIALARAERLFRDKAGSERDVDDARALRNVAQKTLEAAEEKRTLLATLSLDSEPGAAEPITIRSPRDGLLRSVNVAHGQMVPAGTALFECVDLSTVWIRVPVYVGHLREIDTEHEALVGSLAGSGDRESRPAKPVAAPPSADPLSSTADLYYEIDNGQGDLRRGERVGVSLPLRSESENLVVPWAAVLHDIHGGTWVYMRIEPLVYQRSRIQVQRALDDLAVLASGPAVGSNIVVDGAAELFGTEFGIGK